MQFPQVRPNIDRRRVWRATKVPLAFLAVFLFGWFVRGAQASGGLMRYKAEIAMMLGIAAGSFMVVLANDHRRIHGREGMKERFVYFVPIFLVSMLLVIFINPAKTTMTFTGLWTAFCLVGAIMIAAFMSWWFVHRDTTPLHERGMSHEGRYGEPFEESPDDSEETREFDLADELPHATDMEPRIFGPGDPDFEVVPPSHGRRFDDFEDYERGYSPPGFGGYDDPRARMQPPFDDPRHPHSRR